MGLGLPHYKPTLNYCRKINRVYYAALQSSDPMWYDALTSHLTPEQQKSLQDIMVLADQRKAAAESKRIEQSGGMYFGYVVSINVILQRYL